MGRKIPGKKHRGIKDPNKQQARRWAELKTKINEPPRNIDEQAIPKSLERVMKLKDAVKSGKISAKKRRRKSKSEKGLITLGPQNTMRHPDAKPEKSVPIFNQNPGESAERFMHRVSRETHLFVNETTFEQKYGVEIKRNAETGDIEGMQNAPRDEIDELVKLKMKHKNTKKKKKKASEVTPKLTKVQKRREKLMLKKEKKIQNKLDDSKGVREKVEFGDVVHAPPNLKFNNPKVGITGKKDLLLNSIFLGKDASKNTKKISIDRAGKRKDLPSAERRLLEKEQSDVIAAYRLMKMQTSIK